MNDSVPGVLTPMYTFQPVSWPVASPRPGKGGHRRGRSRTRRPSRSFLTPTPARRAPDPRQRAGTSAPLSVAPGRPYTWADQLWGAFKLPTPSMIR